MSHIPRAYTAEELSDVYDVLRTQTYDSPDAVLPVSVVQLATKHWVEGVGRPVKLTGSVTAQILERAGYTVFSRPSPGGRRRKYVLGLQMIPRDERIARGLEPAGEDEAA